MPQLSPWLTLGVALPALLLSACIAGGSVGQDEDLESDGTGGSFSSGSTGSGHPTTSTATGYGGGPEQSTSSSTGSGEGATSSSSTGTGPSSSASSGGGGDTCLGGPKPADPACYWEPICPDADLSDVKSSYSGGSWLSSSLTALDRRYPGGGCLLGMYGQELSPYADTWSFEALSESMMTVLHEGTHGYDYEHAIYPSYFSLYQNCDVTLKIPWLDGFPRSEILAEVKGSGTWLYDGTYLTGVQGTYGFAELLDEWNCYINGMAGIGILGDWVDVYGISGTDGALAFAYYTELYLRVARTQYPSTYADITGDADVVEALRTLWNRMHFFYEVATSYAYLSIEADTIEAELYAPENLAELELVLGSPVGASSCN